MDLVAPAPTDWIVTLRTKDGAVVRYRVSPGTVSEAVALERAMRAGRLSPVQVEQVELCRASERAVALGLATDGLDRQFRALLADARRGVA